MIAKVFFIILLALFGLLGWFVFGGIDLLADGETSVSWLSLVWLATHKIERPGWKGWLLAILFAPIRVITVILVLLYVVGTFIILFPVYLVLSFGYNFYYWAKDRKAHHNKIAKRFIGCSNENSLPWHYKAVFTFWPYLLHPVPLKATEILQWVNENPGVETKPKLRVLFDIRPSDMIGDIVGWEFCPSEKRV